MIPRLAFGPIVVLGIIATVAADASAARIAIQVPIVESDSKVSDGRRHKFHDTLVQGLKEAATPDTTVITGEEVRFSLGDKNGLLECQDGPCLGKVTEALKADFLIVPAITIKGSVGGSIYKVELAVYDKNGSALPITGKDNCGDENEGCNLARAFVFMKRTTAGIAEKIAAANKPEPPKAVAGAPGSELKNPIDNETPPLGQKPSSSSSGSYYKGYRYGWIASAALFGGFLIASIPFAVYAVKENETTCGPNVARNQCPTVYTGNAVPAGLLGLGAIVSGISFGVLFYLDRREMAKSQAANPSPSNSNSSSGVTFNLPEIHVGNDGAALSLSGRF